MRISLFLGVVVFFTLAFAHHEEGHHEHQDDHHEHQDDQHDHKHGHHHNESLACHRLAPYNSKFSFDLYRQVALDHPHENIVFSPISISTAFAFLSLGAKAQTHSQITEGLGFNTSEISEQEIHEGFNHLLRLLNDADRELQLSGGNALFISKEHKILQTFLDEAKRLYHSEAFSTDFKNTEEAKNQINSYVGKNTHGKIPELLDSVDQDTIFVLINYIYFRGKWEKPFDEKWTKEGDFHVNENTTVKVPFMHRTGMYHVAFTDEATVVSIPYKGDAGAMFILPNEGKFSQVEQNFHKESIMKWKNALNIRLVDLSLPKFSVSCTINLKETLSKMGVVDVFSDNADLSGITEEANAKISKAIHKVVISVDEKGTEAAGSTALEIIPIMLPPRVEFIRPFIFTLYDHTTKSVLFAGRIINPREKVLEKKTQETVLPLEIFCVSTAPAPTEDGSTSRSMRVFMSLGIVVLFTLTFADHDHKDGRKHSHHVNESLSCHKIAPYNSKFSFDLYRQVALDHPSENIVFSPISISTAFTFLSLGAKAQTHSQITEGLGFNTSEISEKEINEGFHHLLHLLNDADRELQLSGGNALFISEEHKILQTFVDEAKRLYHSEAFSTDFKKTEEAKNQINSYVEKNTHGKITELLDNVDQDAIFVLINYIYFRGKWQKSFDEKWTKEGDFHVNETTTVKVPFMTRTGMYKVVITKEAIMITKPYKGDVSALFILPDEGKFSEIEQNFNEESIMKWKKSMQMRSVELSLPKFLVSGTINLKETLCKMGVVDVFSDNADLSGITEEANAKISKAIHKAVLSVDEKGTKAAGSSAFEFLHHTTPHRRIASLQDKVEDLENWSRRNNLRVVGLPEAVLLNQLATLCSVDIPKALVSYMSWSPGALQRLWKMTVLQNQMSLVLRISPIEIKMKLFTFLCLSQVLLCTLVCGDHGGPHDHDDQDHDDHDEAKALSQVAQSNICFCYKLHQHLAAAYPNDNIFYSPLSISMAFSLLSLGANANTLSQIREGFGFNTPLVSEETIHKGFKQLLNFIDQPERNLNLNIANALFIDNKQKLLEKFLDGAKKWYHSEAISTDFLKTAEAVKQINSYVEKKTNGKIEDLLDNLDPLTVLVIVNTILFKGSWEHPFNVNRTREEDFQVDKNTVVKVPMMTNHGEYLVAFMPEIGCTIVDVPYKGNTSAFFILPQEGKLHDVEKALQNVSLETWCKEMRPMDIILSIPKFKISAELDLVKELQSIGITEVFSENADLSGITGAHNLKVTKALHKAVIEVDEKGTEAAGATAIGITKLSLPPHIKVNGPFILTIINKDANTMLFTGRIINPKK
ncbi:uncharacterized protein LOC130295746 [Hyla sarda]|uniref:uncharacterized protein LOC130295746 n=1 Tax=Hyla sarda TaxID=327740 RepID=UPI0024C37BD3|nr:uncharacterized protein LOC130295746 [Hyla sarda]